MSGVWAMAGGRVPSGRLATIAPPTVPSVVPSTVRSPTGPAAENRNPEVGACASTSVYVVAPGTRRTMREAPPAGPVANVLRAHRLPSAWGTIRAMKVVPLTGVATRVVGVAMGVPSEPSARIGNAA